MWRDIISNIKINKEKNEVVKSSDESRLKVIFSYIHENYMNKINLEDIANTIHLNKSIDFLKNTNMSISEIAYENGFCTPSYYCEIFKKKTNVTPKEYRNLNKKV